MEFSNRSSLRTQGPIRRGLSLRHSSRGLFSLLRPGVMGPCVRRDDLLRDCTRPRPINVRLNSVIFDSPASKSELRSSRPNGRGSPPAMLLQLNLNSSALEHDREKWVPVFPKRSCSSKKMERAAFLAATTLRKRFDSVCDQRYPTRLSARQPTSQKSASSRVASLKIAISSASRAGVA